MKQGLLPPKSPLISSNIKDCRSFTYPLKTTLFSLPGSCGNEKRGTKTRNMNNFFILSDNRSLITGFMRYASLKTRINYDKFLTISEHH